MDGPTKLGVVVIVMAMLLIGGGSVLAYHDIQENFPTRAEDVQETDGQDGSASVDTDTDTAVLPAVSTRPEFLTEHSTCFLTVQESDNEMQYFRLSLTSCAMLFKMDQEGYDVLIR